MAKKGDLKRIKDMLASGKLNVPDPATGFHYSLYAHCPYCRNESSVYRIERSGVPITRVVFRCSLCCEEFDAAANKMFLR